MDSDNEGLPEDQFINESFRRNPKPFWIWLAVVAAIITFFWGTINWIGLKMGEEISSKPFLQVTNRQFSLFLYQFPQFMRANMPSKTDYLPGFKSSGDSALKPEDAEATVRTPPQVLFIYHTWDRLLADAFIPRPVPLAEFLEFLEKSPAWMPENWAEAPAGYKELVSELGTSKQDDLALLPKSELPQEVRIAFQGWRNFTKEGSQINAVTPTYAEMAAFLRVYPNYSRNYWRNILLEERPKYLESLVQGKSDANAIIPDDELTGFLKTAFYNYQMAKKGA